MSQFARPNRTKTMFATIDANRPTYARQKLGGIESSQSVVKGGTAAQGAENANVQAQSAMVTKQTDDGVRNLAMKPMLDIAQGQAKAATTFGDGAAPVFVNQIAGGGDIVANKDNPTYYNRPTFRTDGTIGEQMANATGTNDALNAGITNNITGHTGALDHYKDGMLSTQLGETYDKESALLDTSRKDLTERHLGQLADTSAFEDQQLQLSSVLADRQSNIGKLQALYGVGYDSDKYGALDSNILQGQFNDAATAATENLAARDSTIKAGDKIREQYLDNVDASKTRLDAQRGETSKRVETIDKEIGDAKIALANLRTRTDEASKKAAAELGESIKQKVLEKSKLIQDTAKIRNDTTQDAYSVGGDGLQNYLANTTNTADVQILGTLGSATGNNYNPGKLGKIISNLSPEGIASIGAGNTISREVVRAAIANTTDPKKKAALQKIESAIVSRTSNESNNKPNVDQERERKRKEDDKSLKAAIVTGGLSTLDKKVTGGAGGKLVKSLFGG